MRSPRRRVGQRLAGAAIAASVLAGCASSPTNRAATTVTSDPASCPTAKLASGRHVQEHGGAERTYLLALPDPEPREPASLIVALHGYGGSASELEARTHLAKRGTAHGAIVVTPDALGSPARWNFDRRPTGPDDGAFIATLVEHLEDELCIDPDRVAVAGSSNGAAFAGLLACTAPYRFAAVAMVIATVPSTCPDGVAPAILTIRGTADQHVRFDGTPDLVAGDARRYGCTVGPTSTNEAPHVRRTRYTGCRGGAEVVLDAVDGGTHRWPTVDDRPVGYDATGAILAFFAAPRQDRNPPAHPPG